MTPDKVYRNVTGDSASTFVRIVQVNVGRPPYAVLSAAANSPTPQAGGALNSSEMFSGGSEHTVRIPLSYVPRE